MAATTAATAAQVVTQPAADFHAITHRAGWFERDAAFKLADYPLVPTGSQQCWRPADAWRVREGG